MADDTRPLGVVSRALPSISTDNTQQPLRLGSYGELMTQPAGNWRHTLAAQGSYFLAQNPTIDASTTLAGHAAPVLANLYTKPFFFMRNDAGSSSQKRIYLDYIYIQVITAGANGTSDNWAAECDTGATRYSSGGSALTTVNPNMQSSATSLCTVYGGAVTAAAATTSQRKMGHGVFRPAIAVTGDKYLFKFGADPMENNVVATATTHHVVPMAPVVLGPTDQFLLHLYAPAQDAAAVYKLQAAWWEA
jgi:hypothetical protein